MLDMTFTEIKDIYFQSDLQGRSVIESMQDQPDWITQELDWNDIRAVIQGGCASGAYMPAVTYYQARETMNQHGDDVLDYIQEQCGDLPDIAQTESWSGIAVFFLSVAVELWCDQFVEYSDWT